MLVVFLFWIVLSIVFLAFGEMAIMIWCYITKEKDSHSIFDKFWVGMSFLGALLLYASLFIPLNIWVLISILAISFGYWLINVSALKRLCRLIANSISRLTAFEKMIFALATIVVLIYSLSVPLSYDAGLYHLQSMLWSEKFSIVTGLANLHGRLGFNSSFFLLSTALQYHPEIYEPFFCINSAALLTLSFWIIYQITKTKNIGIKLVLAFILFITTFTFGTELSSSSTDVLPNILTIYLLLSITLEPKGVLKRAFAISLIASFCLTLKLSSVAILLLIVLTLFTVYKQKTGKLILPILLVGIFIAVPWLTRFVLLTGYLIYPFPAIDIFSVDWKIPIEMVTFEMESAYSWARIPGIAPQTVLAMPLSEWVPIWWGNLSLYKKLLYCFAIASPLMLIFYKFYQQKIQILIWAIAFAGVTYGLATAPDLRFSFGFIACSIAIPAIALLSNIKKFAPRLEKGLIFVLLTIQLIFLTYIAGSQVLFYQTHSAKPIVHLLYKPQTVIMIKSVRGIKFEEYQLGEYTIYKPIAVDQCYDQNIPCTPYYNSNLELRGTKLKDGFRIKK